MPEDTTALKGFDHVADILKPIKLVVWGTLATSLLGSHSVHCDYLLGIPDEQLNLAEQKLLAAGFVRQTWSYCSTIDPATREDDEEYHTIQAMTRPAYENFDKKSLRFQPPDDGKEVQRTVLLPTSYIRLSTSEPGSQTSYAESTICSQQPPLYINDSVHLPNVIMLIQSFLMVYLEEDRVASADADYSFRLELMTWAVGYLYQELELREDILDSSSNEAVKRLFNDTIERSLNHPRQPREKMGRPRAKITNDMIKDFQ